LPGAEVYVVSSVVRGDQMSGSDVDILVVSQSVPRRAIEKAKVKALIEEKLGLPLYHPFEIHLLTPQEAQPYMKRAGEYIEKIR